MENAVISVRIDSFGCAEYLNFQFSIIHFQFISDERS